MASQIQSRSAVQMGLVRQVINGTCSITRAQKRFFENFCALRAVHQFSKNEREEERTLRLFRVFFVRCKYYRASLSSEMSTKRFCSLQWRCCKYYRALLFSESSETRVFPVALAPAANTTGTFNNVNCFVQFIFFEFHVYDILTFVNNF